MTESLFQTGERNLTQSPLEMVHLFSGAYWDEMRIFLAVAKCNSYGKAAELLNKSTPTVSRKVKRLQDVVGAQLIIPSQTGTKLTDKGRQLAEALARLDLLISTLSDELKTEKSEAVGTVRVAATEGLGGFFIAPNLYQVSDAFPNVQVVLQTPTNIERLRDNHTDIMIGFIPEEARGVAVRRLGTVHLIPIMSRAYFEKYGAVTADTISQHRFINTSIYTGASLWEPWLDLVRKGHIAHTAETSFAYGMMVKAGLGIGLLGNYALLEPNAIPVDLNVHIRVPLYIAALSDRLQSRPVRIAFDFLCEVFSNNNPWFADRLKVSQEPTAYDRGFRALFNITTTSGSSEESGFNSRMRSAKSR